ncbi:sugar kinase [Robertmurraya siralis]|uniref:Sugar kinase n=1 Tax=Robertmurraya siralis TaxID=77777 RepID=A0A920BU92_9BACI|nr:nucleoside 2-deoxyribosyltransferase [Robertmurraya siralis]GIN62733.1 sugar kinase [Robertmurraya siralis]
MQKIEEKKLLVIGEVYIDTHLDQTPIQCRLGGIFHSARALHALGQNYALGIISPSYLTPSIDKYSKVLETKCYSTIGEISNAPNVILINESTEAGEQGYEDILYKQKEIKIDTQKLLSLIKEFDPTDILIYPGNYNLLELGEVLKETAAHIHIDFQYEESYLEEFSKLVKLESVILSTSSKFFISKCNGKSDHLLNFLKHKSNSILLKENRGGSRYFSCDTSEIISAPAFINETRHSVGVGDCYNAVFLTYSNNKANSMKIASYVASWYASTFNHETFTSNVKHIHELNDQINELPGIRLEWEVRKNCHIYIAAPDFPHLDTRLIDVIHNSLKYHNFTPHRPIKENGIILGNEDEKTQMETYFKDIELLNKSSILIAVLINDDPGTYVEIGWMSKSNKPTILFDPNYMANNLFLKKTVTRICHTTSEVINSVFEFLGTESEG